MKKLALGIVLATVATATWAACVTQTLTINGRIYTCTTCCYAGKCNTNCT